MKEFLAGFQVDTEQKELAGVCAGILISRLTSSV